MLWYHFGTALWRNIMTQDTNKTFFEGLLALLLGLPEVMNVVLDMCGKLIPYVGKYLKPFFWTMIGLLIVQWCLAVTGFDGFLLSALDGFFSVVYAIGNWVVGLFVNEAAAVLPTIVDSVSGAVPSGSEIPKGT